MELYNFQKRTINKIIKSDAVWLMFDMGLGKTATTLHALEEIKNNYFLINKILIIAPKAVALKTWEQEVEKFKINLKLSQLTNKKEKERIEELNKNADLYVVNFELVPWLVDYLKTRKKGVMFDCLVIDESSKIKDAKTQRFRALRHLIKGVKKKILLTGTPAPNNYIDLWTQSYILDSGERLEKFKGDFLKKYFIPDKRSRNIIFSYKLRPHGAGQIQNQIKDFCVVGGKKEYEEIYKQGRPKLLKFYNKIQGTKNTLENYKTLKRDYVLNVENERVICDSAAVLVNKLRQITGGGIYLDVENSKKFFYIHEEKIKELKRIINEHENENILIYYNFIFERDLILESLKDLNVKEYTEEEVDNWNNGKIKILVAQPLKMSHGVNLQYGGRVVVWYSLTYSLETYLQANARLYRQGQTADVLCYHIILKDTIDEDVADILKDKEERQNKLLESLASYWEQEQQLTTKQMQEIDTLTRKTQETDSVLDLVIKNLSNNSV